MAKQVVCEVVVGGDVAILINGVTAKNYYKNPEVYSNYKDADLNGKKELQEVKVGNVTKYWISVPDASRLIVTKEYLDQRKLRHKKKMELKRKLIIAKKLRMMRYAEMISQGQEIEPTSQDVNDALALKKMEVRRHKGVVELFAA